MTTERLSDDLAHTPASLRGRLGLTQAEVARRAGVSANTVYRIEQGISGYERKTQAVADALQVSYETLLDAMARVRRKAS